MLKARKLVSTKGMSRETWLQYRLLGIGGSNASAIAGLSRWSNPLKEYMFFKGLLPEDPEEALYLRAGRHFEPFIAELFTEETGLKTKNVHYILQHPTIDYMLANVDRQVSDPDHGTVGLEIKRVGWHRRHEWDDEEISPECLIQCHHYMAVTGAPCWYVAALIGDTRLEIRKVMRDPDLEAYLIKIEREFWEMVQNETPPAADGTEMSSELLGVLYPGFDGTELDLSGPEWKLMAEEYLDHERLEKEHKAAKTAISNVFKEVMQNHSVATVCPGVQASWKENKTNRFNMNKFRQDHKALYDEYVEEKSQRRFMLRRKEEKNVSE